MFFLFLQVKKPILFLVEVEVEIRALMMQDA